MNRKPRASSSGDEATPREQIVSSAHLVSPRSKQLSEFEYGLIVSNNAFSRWIVHCMSAAGLRELTPLDVLVLHHVHHRARDKRLSEICFIMNVEDTHLINYSLKKLQNLGVVQSSRNGKDLCHHRPGASVRRTLPRDPRVLPHQRPEGRRHAQRADRRAGHAAARAVRRLRPGRPRGRLPLIHPISGVRT
jgi:hypothetical protein